MKLIIVFTGLIAHIASGPNWWAVAVRATDHEPVLVLHENELEGGCVDPCQLSGTNNEIATIPLKDDRFIIDGLSSIGDPIKSANFDERVPSLKSILGVAVDADVEAGDPRHRGVASAIQLAGGAISAGICLPDAASWPPGHGHLPTCVAENTVWIGDVRGSTVTLKGKKHSWKIKAGARLIVRNEHPGHHFHEYAKLATKSVAAIPKSAPGKACVSCNPVDVQKTVTTADLECTPTRYP